MVVSFSAVLALGLVCVLLLRAEKITPWPLLTSTLFGFFPASSALAPRINALCQTVESLLGSIRL